VGALGLTRPSGSRWRRTPAGPPRLFAHRGASADATENTLAAFALARAQGADGVELDVVRCQTGEVVVFHDDDLVRLAGRPGWVRTMPLTALREVQLKGGGGIPLLTEVMETVSRDLLVNVELKAPKSARARLADDGLAEAVAAIVRLHGAEERVIVSSFDPLLLRRFSRAHPGVATGLLFGAEQGLVLRRGWLASALRPTALHPEAVLVSPAALRRWRARGYAVNVWTVDDPAELRALDALGVDGLITNRPAAARAALGP
jgi:glycerophosphoryl diester phosphodiesterase